MIDIAERLKFLSNSFGKGHLARDGSNAAFKCPKCQHKEKKKLMVKLDDELWHCFVCGIRGRSITSLLSKHGAKGSRGEWIRLFGSEEQKKFIDEPEKEEVLALPNGFIPLIDEKSDPDYRAVLRYLEERGIGEDLIWRYRIGTSLKGKCRRRAVITSYDACGKLNYWTARSIDNDTVKYYNPTVERVDVIFNEIDIDWNKELMIVEGPFDMIAAGGNTTCLLGSSMTPSHAIFQRIVGNKTPIILSLDNDVQKKAHNIAKMLFNHGVCVKFLNTGAYKDVGEMPQNEILDARNNAKEWEPNDRILYMIKNIKSGSLL